MERLVFILLTICLTNSLYAQDINIEAKMAYQLAENFEAQEYTKALDYLDRAEKALGRKNPSMAYLKVMITKELILASSMSDSEAFIQIEKILDDFENLENKEALGEDKLMEIYRVKIEQEERQTKIKQVVERKRELEATLPNIINDALGDLPPTGVPTESVVDNKYLDVLKRGNGFKRRIRKHGSYYMLYHDPRDDYFGYLDKKVGDKVILSLSSNKGTLLTSYEYDIILSDKEYRKETILTLEQVLKIIGLLEVKEYLSIGNDDYSYLIAYADSQVNYKLSVSPKVFQSFSFHTKQKFEYLKRLYLKVEALEVQHSK